MFYKTNLKTSEKKVKNVRPKFKFLVTLQHHQIIFLPSADSKAVRRRPRKHFLTPPLPPSLPPLSS
jgi:hypothetical protein